MNSARDLTPREPFASSMMNREQRRALKVLADAPRGVSEEMLVVVHGFSAQMVAGLVHAGLAKRPAASRTRLSVSASRMLGRMALERYSRPPSPRRSA